MTNEEKVVSEFITRIFTSGVYLHEMDMVADAGIVIKTGTEKDGIFIIQKTQTGWIDWFTGSPFSFTPETENQLWVVDKKRTRQYYPYRVAFAKMLMED